MNAPARIGAVAGIGRGPGNVPAIGQILLARGAVSQGNLALALESQAELGCRLGELLCARGWTREDDVAAALAEQWGLPLVDLTREPPDPELVGSRPSAAHWLDCRALPWRRHGAGIIHVTDDPARAAGRVEGALVVAPTGAFEAALRTLLGPELARRAVERTPPAESVRTLAPLRALLALLAGLAAVALASGAGGAAVASLVALVVLVTNTLTGGLRLAAVLAGAGRSAAVRTENLALIRWPRISVLVPLYREERMVGEIVAALAACDYPRELLDVKLLAEAHDTPTIAAIRGADLPGWIELLVVPDGHPRTKPRALNFALDFCRGEIVGVLDAEDRPDPDQFRRVALHLATSGPEVACVQCQLSYFNARENWITRCFQIEYAIWFDVLLRGFERLGLPIPLGGTSVYFRRAVLPEIGGWDAHNVTEDADLGMRLARRGLKVAVVGATTFEEANCRTVAWVRQRSRWLKGYLLTWLSHMRRPARLIRELGPAGFLGLNVLLLGGAFSYLAMPLFWLSVVGVVVTGRGVWDGMVPDALLLPLGLSLAAGQAVMLGCAALAMHRRGTPGLLLWLPVLPFYWTLGALAAWKAVAEVFLAPYYWDKTRHGISRHFGRGGAASPKPWRAKRSR